MPYRVGVLTGYPLIWDWDPTLRLGLIDIQQLSTPPIDVLLCEFCCSSSNGMFVVHNIIRPHWMTAFDGVVPDI